MNCPKCSAAISLKDISYQNRFLCPACGCSLGISRTYPQVLFWFSFCTAAAFAYALGFRGWAWPAIALLATFPINVILQGTAARLFPPTLRADRIEVKGPLDHFSIHDPPDDPNQVV